MRINIFAFYAHDEFTENRMDTTMKQSTRTHKYRIPVVRFVYIVTVEEIPEKK